MFRSGKNFSLMGRAMKKRQGIWMAAILAFALGKARAQDTAAPSSGSAGQGASQTTSTQTTSDQTAAGQTTAPATTTQQPVPAYGQNLPSLEENPPISGLDQPGLEPHGAPLSYLQPGATVSESADSNIQNSLGGGAVQSISRGLGSLELQRLWSHYDLAAQYIGGFAYYNEQDLGWKLLQQMDLDQKITWKRGELSLRDSFSYLPEGDFGAAYGSLGSQGIASLGNTSFGTFWGGSGLGTYGIVPRITNVSIVDISENLTPKSAVTAAGGYAVTHFYGTAADPETGQQITLLNNSQVSAQLGYDRILSPRTQVAVMYGYQGFDFSSLGEAFHSHVIMGMYGHRITGRLDFLIAAGPQLTDISLGCTIFDLPNSHCSVSPSGNVVGSIPDRRIGGAGRLRLRYQLPRTSLDLSYERFETGGSGFFSGAETDLAVLSATHDLTRVWNVFSDIGYSRNSRVEPVNTGAISANSYTYGFIGAGVHRAFGRNFHGFVSYQFNQLAFDNAYCAGLSPCNRIGNRSVGTIGLDWTPRPIRID
jgi:hypothetical protein